MPNTVTPTLPETERIAGFIKRWEASGAAERANYQLFLSELCDVLNVPRPDPATPDTRRNAYVFERAVTFHHGDGSTSPGRIDRMLVAQAQSEPMRLLTHDQILPRYSDNILFDRTATRERRCREPGHRLLRKYS